ncbi:MAG: arylamine N-acetyltransferase [Sphingopyxis sp.]|uniref:arylamine N-acetyltransferase family protein n=1 Tax=Sphingopyxis sp. TaxID=1908224 RepID=UPI003D80C8F7
MLTTPASPAPDADTADTTAGAPGESAAFLAAYLARIGLAAPPPPTLAGLTILQAAHQAAIPFEAIDVLTGEGVDLDPQAIAAKLIGARRGGYCFEQNALFLRVLRATGFAAEGLLGRVRLMVAPDAPPTPRTHMVVRVMLDGRPWLADVGFGALVPPQPLALDSGAVQPTPHQPYRIAAAGDGPGETFAVMAKVEGEWTMLYIVDAAPPPAIDYEVGNWYTATHPQSHFRHRLIAARTTATARYGLLDNRLTIRGAGGSVERRWLDADGIAAALRDIFGLAVRPGWRTAIERAATAEVPG